MPQSRPRARVDAAINYSWGAPKGCTRERGRCWRPRGLAAWGVPGGPFLSSGRALERWSWGLLQGRCLFFFKIYLFMAVLGLRFCVRAFSSCGEWGPLFIVVRGPLTIAASLVAEQRLQTLRLSSCGLRAQLLHGMWDLPRPGLEPVSPALAGRFSTTVPPGKPRSEERRVGKECLRLCRSRWSPYH